MVRALATPAGGDNLLAAEAIKLRVAEVRREVAGPDPTPVERLLAERVALDWLAVHCAELTAAEAAAGGGAAAPGPTARQAEVRLERAHRRYLAGLRTLAVVRKLTLPALRPVEVAARLEGRACAAGRVNRRSPALAPAATAN